MQFRPLLSAVAFVAVGACSADDSNLDTDASTTVRTDVVRVDVRVDARVDARADTSTTARPDTGTANTEAATTPPGDDADTTTGNDAGTVTPADTGIVIVLPDSSTGTDAGAVTADAGGGGRDGGAATGCTSSELGRALVLPSDSVSNTLSTRGGDVDTYPTCGPMGSPITTTGSERIYPLHIATTTRVTLDTNNADTGADTIVSILRTCDDGSTAVACNDDVSRTNYASRVVVTLDPGDYFVVVDRNTAGGGTGAFTLNLTSSSPSGSGDAGTTSDSGVVRDAGIPADGGTAAGSAVCSSGTPLAFDTTYTASLDGSTGVLPRVCPNRASGPAKFFTVHLAMSQTATITVVPDDTFDPVVQVLRACSGTCGTSRDDGLRGDPETLYIVNPYADQTDFWVGVGSYSSSDTTGTFTIRVTTP